MARLHESTTLSVRTPNAEFVDATPGPSSRRAEDGTCPHDTPDLQLKFYYFLRSLVDGDPPRAPWGGHSTAGLLPARAAGAAPRGGGARGTIRRAANWRAGRPGGPVSGGGGGPVVEKPRRPSAAAVSTRRATVGRELPVAPWRHLAGVPVPHTLARLPGTSPRARARLGMGAVVRSPEGAAPGRGDHFRRSPLPSRREELQHPRSTRHGLAGGGTGRGHGRAGRRRGVEPPRRSRGTGS